MHFSRRGFFRRRTARTFGLKLRLRQHDGLADGGQNHADGPDGVVVRGNGKIHQVGIAIRVHDGHERQLEFARLGDGVVLAFDVHNKHRGGNLVHRADAVEIFVQPAGFAADDRLLLFDVIGQRAVRFHFLNFLQPLDGGLNRVVIRQRAAEPALGDKKLAAFLRRILDALLRLLFGADEHHLAAFANGLGQKVARGFELRERLAEVNDVNAVARIEDERLHLGIPTLRLVSEMDARFQQFFYANA